jgi:Na+-translocating ferredoxin:NAD+ oxidoreductase RnfG subunit
LSQSYNRHNDSLKNGTDIQAVSGATFSAVALVKNVNRINKKLKEYFSD